MFDAGHPGGAAFYAHAETGVRDAAVAAEVEVPFEGRLVESVILELLDQVIKVCGALAAADDLTVAFGDKQIYAKRTFRAVFIDLEIETLDRGREMMDKNRFTELI